MGWRGQAFDYPVCAAVEKYGRGRSACFAATLLAEWALDHPIPEIS
jgi:hypothetical protein